MEQTIQRKDKKTVIIQFLLSLGMLLLTVIAAFFMIHRVAGIGIEESMIFEIGVGIVTMAAAAMLLMIVALDQTPQDESGVIFTILVILVYIGAAATNVLWDFSGSPMMRIHNIIITTFSFLSTVLLEPLFWMYQYELLRTEKERSQTAINAVFLCSIFNIAATVILSALEILFYIDNDGIYHIGYGYPIVLLLPIILSIINVILNIRSQIAPLKRAVLLIFSVSPVLVTILNNIYFPDVQIVQSVLLLDLMLIYGVIHMDRSMEYAERGRVLAEQSRDLTEKRTQIMVSQIQPHFIYNTLNTISALCEEDPLLARDVTVKFADYLRGNLHSIQDNRLEPFSKELEHTMTYLWIEEQRFGDLLKTKLDIGCTDFLLPPLTLQPLVENAVKHGICEAEDGGTVTIRTRRENGSVIITVADDGVGFDVAELDGESKGIGIDNVRKRLQLLCGGELSITSIPGYGTEATIRMDENSVNRLEKGENEP
ncbi:MAG: histidine kinase [Clostridia bacterium]|nr:histidine kinase [Clostridia bacterium]